MSPVYKQRPPNHGLTDATFDDVDPAVLALDSMNYGQSHRERMRANLAAKSGAVCDRDSFAPRAESAGGTRKKAPGSRRGDVRDDHASHTQIKK